MPSVEEILAAVDASDASGGLTSLERLCAECCRMLRIVGAGVALRPEAGRHELIAAAGGVAETLEDVQLTLGEGPGVDAFSQGAPVLESNLAAIDENRWVGFASAAAQAGVGAVFAFPLQIGAIRLGTLNLYRESAGELDDDDLADALRYTDAAILLLLLTQDQRTTATGRYPELDALAHAGPELHQATGMIAIQASIALDAALLILRGYAFSIERPIMEVARDVVAGGLHFHPEDDRHE